MSQELQPLPSRRTATDINDAVGTQMDIEILWKTLIILIETVRGLMQQVGNGNGDLTTIIESIEDLQEQINNLTDRVATLEAQAQP